MTPQWVLMGTMDDNSTSLPKKEDIILLSDIGLLESAGLDLQNSMFDCDPPDTLEKLQEGYAGSKLPFYLSLASGIQSSTASEEFYCCFGHRYCI